MGEPRPRLARIGAFANELFASYLWVLSSLKGNGVTAFAMPNLGGLQDEPVGGEEGPELPGAA